MYDTDKINEYDDWISKSQKKRDSKKLYAIAEKIVDLRENEFDRIDFSDYSNLKEELVLARKFNRSNQFEPFRRQMLHIERLMRSIDELFTDELNNQIESTISRNNSVNTRFHRIEKLRDYLLADESFMKMINNLVYLYPLLDKNKLRQYILNSRKNVPNVQYYKTELFRYLRDNIEGDLVEIKDFLK